MASEISTDSESSILSANLCDICEASPAQAICVVCKGGMCACCTEIHMNTKLFKGHVIIADYGDVLYDEKDEPVEIVHTVMCDKHPKQRLKFYCGDCVCFSCEKCADDHKGHSLTSVENKMEISDEVCHQLIKRFAAEALHCDKYRKVIEDLKSYDEVINEVKKYKKEIIQHVEDKSNELIRKLLKTKGVFEKVLLDETRGLKTVRDDIDRQINLVASLWKVEERKVLLPELVAAEKLTHGIEAFGKRLTRMAEPGVSDILPNKEQMKTLKSTVDDIFTMSNAFEITAFGPDPSNLKEVASVEIKSPKGNDYNSWSFGRSDGRGHVILYSGKEIRVFNPDTNVFVSQHTLDCDISGFVTLEPGTYMCIGDSGKGIFFLDKEFLTEAWEKSKENMNICSIDYLSPRRYVKFEKTKSSETHLSLIDRSNSSEAYFSVTRYAHEDDIDEEESPWFTESEICVQDLISSGCMKMGVHCDKTHITVCGDSWEMFKINLEDKTVAKNSVDYPSCGQYGFYVDGADSLWMVDKCNNIHLYDMHLHHKVVLSASGGVCDITIHGSRLLVLTRHYSTSGSSMKLSTYESGAVVVDEKKSDINDINRFRYGPPYGSGYNAY